MAVDGPKYRTLPDISGARPFPKRTHRAGEWIFTMNDADDVARAFLIGFALSNEQSQPVGRVLHVVNFERGDFAAPQRAGKSHEQDRSIAERMNRIRAVCFVFFTRKAVDHQLDIFRECRRYFMFHARFRAHDARSRWNAAAHEKPARGFRSRPSCAPD